MHKCRDSRTLRLKVAWKNIFFKEAQNVQGEAQKSKFTPHMNMFCMKWLIKQCYLESLLQLPLWSKITGIELRNTKLDPPIQKLTRSDRTGASFKIK